MRIVERVLPVTAAPTAQGGVYRLADGFFRFWFRFVFRFQDDLSSGLRPTDLYDTEVRPALADHVAPVFEQVCRGWVRAEMGAVATRVGSWWGRARDDLRRTGSGRQRRSTSSGWRVAGSRSSASASGPRNRSRPRSSTTCGAAGDQVRLVELDALAG
jgi:uncharacterized protein